MAIISIIMPFEFFLPLLILSPGDVVGCPSRCPGVRCFPAPLQPLLWRTARRLHIELQYHRLSKIVVFLIIVHDSSARAW